MEFLYSYKASLTREPFLFYEMRSTAKLMAEGNSDDAIVKEIAEQNLFQYPTEKSITRMAKACIKRLHALEDNQLSGGQQQRVSIGRALIANPAIVLADEPTGNLDSKNSQEIIDLLKISNSMYQQTVIIITHDTNIALKADRILRIEDGRIVSDEVNRP